MDYRSVSDIHNYNIDVGMRTLYIHNPMNGIDGHEIDERVSNEFLFFFHYLDSISNEKITVYLNSHGGEYLAGLSMYDAMIESKSHIVIIGHGDVSSTSSVILQAGDERYLTKNCWLVVHNGVNCIEGNSNAIQNAANADKQMLNGMLNIYASRCYTGEFFNILDASMMSTKRWIANKLTKESDWWLSAEEAVTHGFADKIYKKD